MKKLLLLFFLAFSFGMNAQDGTITSVSPNTGVLGQTLLVTITGEDTHFTQVSDTYNVSFYNQMQQQFVINAIQMVSDTELIANVTIPITNAPNSYNLMVMQGWSSTEVMLANAFTVTTTLNSISGNIRMDGNSNGCDPSDTPSQGIRVALNDGVTTRYAFTNANGEYIFYVPAGNYTVTPEFDSPLFSMSPLSASFSFATENNLSETQDFCLAPIGVHKDLVVVILPTTPARPGFDATYALSFENKGNQTLSGTLQFVFDDTRLDFVSATTAPTTQTTNNLEWNYGSLAPFERRTIRVVLNVNTPQETPPVNNDDIFNFTVTINPVSGDDTPTDNVVNFEQVVLGPWDPNDKAVTEGAEIPLSSVGKYLHYLIRFQNKGTFYAENVRIKDVLSDNLDKSSLEIVSASHPYRATLTSGNELEFFFDNINLPAEQDDEPGSNGYVAFKIKTLSTLGIGSSVDNTAGIYFDFNFPIITNTVTTTVTALSTTSFDLEDGIVLYPNPAGDVLHLEAKSGFEVTSVEIFNQLGQLVKSVNAIEENRIAVNDLKTGTYFVRIVSGNANTVKKLIKL